MTPSDFAFPHSAADATASFIIVRIGWCAQSFAGAGIASKAFGAR
jgi:hypothetical protein